MAGAPMLCCVSVVRSSEPTKAFLLVQTNVIVLAACIDTDTLKTCAWNDLPEELLAVADRAEFRKQLETYFLGRIVYA